MTTNIKIGPVTFTPAFCVGFTAAGLVWACVVSLYAYPEGILQEPSVLATLGFWAFVVAGVWLFQDLGQRFDEVLDRLWNRGALAMTAAELDEFKRDVRAKSDLAARIGGVCMALLVVVFYVVGKREPPKASVLFTLWQHLSELFSRAE